MRPEAQERLLALEECCGLGEGFKLAERDMAGELLRSTTRIKIGA
jgi:transcription-repair coupling factor (superfamily II helicase)